MIGRFEKSLKDRIDRTLRETGYRWYEKGRNLSRH